MWQLQNAIKLSSMVVKKSINKKKIIHPKDQSGYT